MNRRKYAGISASLIILILLVVITGYVLPGGDTPADAGNNRCAEIEYLGMAPVVSEDSIAFGPNVAEFIEGFDTLVQTPEGLVEVVNAVRGEQVNATCRYTAMTLALAMHRGLEPWPVSDQDWIDRLAAIDSDREAHHALANKVLEWNDAAQAEIVFLNEPYNSDWFERTDDRPLLRQGPGHSDVAGWVVRWSHLNEDGTTTVVTERLVCYYQFVGAIPPTVPPVGIPSGEPPTTSTPPGTNPPPTMPPGTVPTTVPPTTAPPTTVVCPPPAGVLPEKWDYEKCKKLPTPEDEQQNGDTGVGQEPQDNDTSGVDVGPTPGAGAEPPLQPPTPAPQGPAVVAPNPTPTGTNSGSPTGSGTPGGSTTGGGITSTGNGAPTAPATDTGQGGSGNGNAEDPFG